MSVVDEIIQREGKEFTMYKNDKGGATKFGITQKTLAEFRGGSVTVEDVKNLTEEEARQIYQDSYITKSPFRNISDPLRAMLIDWAVTSGSDDPTKAVQTLVNEYGAGIKVDGIFGPRTEQALSTFIQQWGAKLVYDKIVDARVIFYASLVQKDPTQSQFIKGWVIRALSFRRY